MLYIAWCNHIIIQLEYGEVVDLVVVNVNDVTLRDRVVYSYYVIKWYFYSCSVYHLINHVLVQFNMAPSFSIFMELIIQFYIF